MNVFNLQAVTLLGHMYFPSSEGYRCIELNLPYSVVPTRLVLTAQRFLG